MFESAHEGVPILEELDGEISSLSDKMDKTHTREPCLFEVVVEAKDVDEAQKLAESGFEYVTTFDNTMLFKKRK